MASNYVNDALGRRFSRSAGGVTTTSYFDGAQPLTDWRGGSVFEQYLYGDGLVRADGDTGFCDAGGSVRRVTNAAGQGSIWNVDYDTFGNVESSYGSTASPLGYGAQSGYRNETDCHLLLSGARSWDTTTGRFLTRDTDLGQAPYAYCDGDPVNFTDPSGHASKLSKWWQKLIHSIGLGITIGTGLAGHN